jgi:Domain of unknown function (DUF4386)
MESRRLDFSPLALARTGGALYLVIIVLGLFAEMFVRGRLVVPGDAAATALRLTSFLFHGHLISRAGLLPRILGIVIQIAGVAYLTNSFALIIDPSVAGRLFPAILLPPFVAEVSPSLWLLVKGVDVEKWLVVANQ